MASRFLTTDHRPATVCSFSDCPAGASVHLVTLAAGHIPRFALRSWYDLGWQLVVRHVTE
jgi:hypothetical protein